jgi:hypothetical protein
VVEPYAFFAIRGAYNLVASIFQHLLENFQHTVFIIYNQNACHLNSYPLPFNAKDLDWCRKSYVFHPLKPATLLHNDLLFGERGWIKGPACLLAKIWYRASPIKIKRGWTRRIHRLASLRRSYFADYKFRKIKKVLQANLEDLSSVERLSKDLTFICPFILSTTEQCHIDVHSHLQLVLL